MKKEYNFVIILRMIIIIKNKILWLTIITLIFSFFSFTLTAEAEFKCDLESVKKASSEADATKVRKICDKEIAEARSSLKKKQGETSGVRSEIRKLNQKIRISGLFINQKLAIATRLKGNINDTKDDINGLNSDLKKINNSLKALIFKRNQAEANTALEAILSKKTISEFFKDKDISRHLEARISQEIVLIRAERDSLKRLILELEEKESVERDLADRRKIETGKIERNKRYKDDLLGILKREEGGIKAVITSRERAKQAILAKMFKVASGDKVSFGEAYNIIYPHRRALGMDPAFILAILFQESGMGGKIGGNIGQCTYKQFNRHGSVSGGKTVMRLSQHKAFETIMRGLGLNAKTQKVSCPIPRDGGHGGAMGPAQFMPRTWMDVRPLAARIIGKKPEEMSPFINQHAFVASAAYLRRHYYSAACNKYAADFKHIQSTRTLRERCAASKYYAGRNWFRFRMSYGESVVRRANRFRADIQTLES